MTIFLVDPTADAVDYANERVVFYVPIGSNQAFQHPLADSYADLELAKLMTSESAWIDDNGESNVVERANIANLKAGEAAWTVCEQARTTFSGPSVGSDVGIAKFWEEVRHQRSAPVSEEMIRNYIGTRSLASPGRT